MTIPSVVPIPGRKVRPRILGRTRLVILLALLALLVACAVFSWNTRDAMAHLPFLKGQGRVSSIAGGKTLVDLSPWQTAQALAPLAVTAEEAEYARDAERLADHEVDQAFAAALRQAALQVQSRVLTGEALELSQKVARLQQLVNQDQALVERLTPKSKSPAGDVKESGKPASDDDDLEVAKAQLGLESDELAEAQEDLDRVSGDNRAQIQSELTAHEAAMRKYDSESHDSGQVAVLSARQDGTLVGRLKVWTNQRDRYRLIQQAEQQAQADIASLSVAHNALETKANTIAAAGGGDIADRAAHLANIKDRSAERQLLSIYDDRMQTEKQLAAVYGKWSSQVLLQHRILFHLILQSLEWIVFILICMVVGDALVGRFVDPRSLDRRQMQTLRTVLEVGIQVIGVVLILIVVFGVPQQTSTLLGLTTAGLTIALQDFILAFFGWFVLMGKNGIRVGDWVEINGVGGEVLEIGMFYTALLETGTLGDKGQPTGRRIPFANSFAIRGQYFNFTTTGRWMWDEIAVSLSASENIQTMVERIQKAVVEETEENTRLAEEEWRSGKHWKGMSKFSAAPAVNLRPSGTGVSILVRYITRASERFEVRNRLYQRVINLRQARDGTIPTQPAKEGGKT